MYYQDFIVTERGEKIEGETISLRDDEFIMGMAS